MTKFDCSANWRPVMVLLAISIAIVGIGGAAAQSGEAPPKRPAAADKESKKKVPAPDGIESSEGQSPQNTAPSGGLKVVKDPETGKLRGPDRAEAAKLGGPSMNRSIEGLRPERRPNGVNLVDLQGRFQSYTVATRKENGGIEIECQNTAPSHTHAEHGEGTKSRLADPDAPKDSAVNVHAK